MGDAENLMTREGQAVTERHGHGSREWAAAQCDLGNVLIEADQRERAIDCYRRAACATPRDHESRRDQLSYRLNLGLALREAGRLDEAETQLRQGAEERLAFYGREHAGYAYGLVPLAGLLRPRGGMAEGPPGVGGGGSQFWLQGRGPLCGALWL